MVMSDSFMQKCFKKNSFCIGLLGAKDIKLFDGAEVEVFGLPIKFKLNRETMRNFLLL